MHEEPGRETELHFYFLVLLDGEVRTAAGIAAGRPAWDMRAHTAWNTHARAAACGRHGGRPAWDTRAPTAAWNTHARAAAWDADFAIKWMRGGRQRAYLRAEGWYLATCQKMPSQIQNCWRQVIFHFLQKTKHDKPV